jgi:uncharacterized damage-inducible protein DinB
MILEKAVRDAITGKGAHVEAKPALERLDWKSAGSKPEGAPHSIFQLVNHLVYWQEWVLKWLSGKKPTVPKHASGSWPGRVRPASAKDWQQTVKRFLSGLDKLEGHLNGADLCVKKGEMSRLEMIQPLVLHNSYHLGQVVLLRQMLGKWPPPSGGLTW